MLKKILLGLLVAQIILFATPSWANDQNLSPPGDFKHQRVSEYFYDEVYGVGNLGLEGCLAYQYHYYLSEHQALCAMVTGAAGGNRGGYGTASIGLSQSTFLSPQWEVAGQVLIGAGGGHGLPAGGGLLLNAAISLNYKPDQGTGILLRVGYLNFLLGSYAVPYIGVGLVTDALLQSL